MAKHNEYYVVPRKDGTWAVELPHAEKASAVKDTQKAAIKTAHRFSPEGVVHVKQNNGKSDELRCVRKSREPPEKYDPATHAKPRIQAARATYEP